MTALLRIIDRAIKEPNAYGSETPIVLIISIIITVVLVIKYFKGD